MPKNPEDLKQIFQLDLDLEEFAFLLNALTWTAKSLESFRFQSKDEQYRFLEAAFEALDAAESSIDPDRAAALGERMNAMVVATYGPGLTKQLK